jgi:hypothetical protein
MFAMSSMTRPDIMTSTLFFSSVACVPMAEAGVPE